MQNSKNWDNFNSNTSRFEETNFGKVLKKFLESFHNFFKKLRNVEENVSEFWNLWRIVMKFGKLFRVF